MKGWVTWWMYGTIGRYDRGLLTLLAIGNVLYWTPRVVA